MGMSLTHLEEQTEVEADRQDSVHLRNSSSHLREEWCREQEMEWRKERSKRKNN